MRKNGIGSSAAYFVDTKKLKVTGTMYELPNVGTYIILNEMCTNIGSGHFKGIRGCFYVESYTDACVLCYELYSPEVKFRTSFLKTDIARGYYRFEYVEGPAYRCDLTWMDYDLVNF